MDSRFSGNDVLFLGSFEKAILACLGLALLLSTPAAAHPHVWIDYEVKVIGAKDGVTKLRFTWRLDAMFTAMVKEDFKLKDISEEKSAFIKKSGIFTLSVLIIPLIIR